MAEDFNTTVISATKNMLHSLKISFTEDALRKKMEWNPEYPSMFSISEVLDNYKIKNKGLKIEAESLDSLPLPFLAYIYNPMNNSEDFVNVTTVSSDTITYFDDKEKTVSRNDFLEAWSSRVVLLVEKEENSKEVDYFKNKLLAQKEKNRKLILTFGFGLILVAGMFNFILSSNNILPSLLSVVIVLIGLSSTVFILIHEVDKSNAFVKNICTAGVKTSCDAVLGSKGAKIFGISWGEIGFFYFSFILLFHLIPAIDIKQKVSWITYFNVLSALYIPFSIYYQYKIVKQWCPLCLVVQASLLLSLINSILFGSFSIIFTLASVGFIMLCASLPILVWYTAKPLITNSLNVTKYESAFKRLFFQKDIFNITLNNQPIAYEGWEHLGLIKGNPDAEITILKVCSPQCGHCDKAHATFNKLLDKNDNIKIITLYDVGSIEESNTMDVNDFQMPVMHFFALADENSDRASAAMDYWYFSEKKSYEELKKNFPVEDELVKRQKSKLVDMSSWCAEAIIEYTPTVYINEKKLSSTFDLEELLNIF